MAIGLGLERVTALMNFEYSGYRGARTGLTLLSPVELETFDSAIPKILNRHYKPRVSGAIYATYAGNYLVGLMRAKKALGDLVYNGNDGEAGILSKELCFDMFYDDTDTPPIQQKLGWSLVNTPVTETWEPMHGITTALPSTIANDEFGSMVISHITSLNANANILEIQYHINGNPQTPQYVEAAFKLNEDNTYLFDVPMMIGKNTKLFVEGLCAISGLPITIMQGGICFATANWFNAQHPTLT